jgi:hypothetical protein
LIAPTVASLAVMWVLNNVLSSGWLVELTVLGLAGLVAYLIVYLLWGLTPAERRGLSRLVARVRGA